MLRIFSFLKKKKSAMVRDTLFLCPEETEKAQRDIDEAHKKSDAAHGQAMKSITLMGIEAGKLNPNNT